VLFTKDHFFSMTPKLAPKAGRCCSFASLTLEEAAMKPLLSLPAALFLSAVLVAPEIAAAAGEESPAPPPPPSQDKSTKGTQTKKPKTDKSSSAEDFLRGYHAAYALIYDEADYVGGIAALRALGYDDHPDVATLIGYASRKLGHYDDAKLWYERALAADPNHAVTWSYYGMWHAEQGNVLKARDVLEKVRLICGNTDCRPYRMLRDVIDDTATY
jgi:tetratricopeptide (TPR) repeat protein